MTRPKNNKNEKRTLRKRYRKDTKSKRRRTRAKNKKNKKNKKTLKKKKINLQIGGNIEPMMARVLHTLERDIIEYLPSTKVVDTIQSEKHYLEMVDYIKLQEIINNNENFKKSPKIRKLFDYDLYEINNKDMYFVYKDFKCENIFKDVDKYYIYILYFYLMECNITRNDKIQQDGGNNNVLSDPVSEPSEQIPVNIELQTQEKTNIVEENNEEKIPQEETVVNSPEEGKPPETPPINENKIVKEPSEKAPVKEEDNNNEEKMNNNEEKMNNNEEKMNNNEEEMNNNEEEMNNNEEEMNQGVDNIEETKATTGNQDILQIEMNQLRDDEKNINEEVEEEDDGMEENIEVVNEIELPGFQEYEETRRMLDMKSNVVNGNIKITNSDLIKYKVNWFNVCMGIDIFDTGFENKVNSKLEEVGIKPFKRNKFLEKIALILDDKEMTTNFKSAIYERLIENCKEPEDFINNKKNCENPSDGHVDKFLGLFRKCHEKEMKDNDGILYLYDKYKTILNQNTTNINNVDMVLIILNCEIRQRILSYHISVEMIRRRNSINKAITSILENIYEIDKPVIKEVEDELRNKIAQEKIERRQLIEQVNKKEIEMRKEQMLRKRDPELIDAILRKQRENNYDVQTTSENEENNKDVGLSDKKTDDFITNHKEMLKNNTLIGGRTQGLNVESVMVQNDNGSHNVLDGIHTKRVETEFCSSIDDAITGRHLKSPTLLNTCKNF